MLFEGESFVFISPYLIVPVLLLVVVLVYYMLRKFLRTMRDRIDEPFESTEGRTTISQLRARLPRTRFLAAAVLIIVVVPSIIVVEQMPVNGTNIEHSDSVGDVSNPNIDIVQIRSYLNGTDLYLELTVAGSIVEINKTTLYQYRLTIVTKGVEADVGIAIYQITYQNGSVSGCSAYGYAKGDTLTLVVSIYAITSGLYMTGLEGRATSGSETDYTSPDRSSEVAHARAGALA